MRKYLLLLIVCCTIQLFEAGTVLLEGDGSTVHFKGGSDDEILTAAKVRAYDAMVSKVATLEADVKKLKETVSPTMSPTLNPTVSPTLSPTPPTSSPTTIPKAASISGGIGNWNFEQSGRVTLFHQNDPYSFIPEGDMQVIMKMRGAGGGNGGDGGSKGGNGGSVEGRVLLLKGQTYYIYVGGRGKSKSGRWGGGGGGTTALTNTQNDVYLVAAGGGGGAGYAGQGGSGAGNCGSTKDGSTNGGKSGTGACDNNAGTGGSGGRYGGQYVGEGGNGRKGGSGGGQSCDSSLEGVSAFGRGGGGCIVSGDGGGGGGGGGYAGGGGGNGDAWGGAGGGGSSYLHPTLSNDAKYESSADGNYGNANQDGIVYVTLA